MKNFVQRWFTALFAAVIHGAVTSALTVAGLAGGHALTSGVPPVNIKSFFCALATGGVYSGFLLLKKSPLPGVVVTDNDEVEIVKTDDTSTLTKDQTKP